METITKTVVNFTNEYNFDDGFRSEFALTSFIVKIFFYS